MTKGKITEQELAPSVRTKLENIPNDTGAAIQAVSNALVHYGETTGTNTKSLTVASFTGSLAPGLGITFKNTVANTGAVTLNVNGLGAKPIVKNGGVALSSGNLKLGGVYTVRYDGTNFILQGEGGSGNATVNDVVAGKTFTNDNGEQIGLGDSNLIPKNVRKGTTIFGVTGTSLSYENGSYLMGSDQFNSSEITLAYQKYSSMGQSPSSSGLYRRILANEIEEENAFYAVVSPQGQNTTYYIKKVKPTDTSSGDEVVWEKLMQSEVLKLWQGSDGYFYAWCRSTTEKPPTIEKFDKEGNTLWTKSNSLLGSADDCTVDNAGNFYCVINGDIAETIIKYDQDFNKVWANGTKKRMKKIEVMDNGFIYCWYSHNYQYGTDPRLVGVWTSSGVFSWEKGYSAYTDGYGWYPSLLAFYVDKKNNMIYHGYSSSGYSYYIESLSHTGSVIKTLQTTNVGYQSGARPGIDHIGPGPNGNLIFAQSNNVWVTTKSLSVISTYQNYYSSTLFTYGAPVVWLKKGYLYFRYSNYIHKFTNRDIYRLP